jgi:hypothetical protein
MDAMEALMVFVLAGVIVVALVGFITDGVN